MDVEIVDGTTDIEIEVDETEVVGDGVVSLADAPSFEFDCTEVLDVVVEAAEIVGIAEVESRRPITYRSAATKLLNIHKETSAYSKGRREGMLTLRWVSNGS